MNITSAAEEKTTTIDNPVPPEKTEVGVGMIRLDIVMDGKYPSMIKTVCVKVGVGLSTDSVIYDGKIIATFLNPTTGEMKVVVGKY